MKEIIPNKTVLPVLFESIPSKAEKDSENPDKVGDSTIRAEMTMPISPIMVKAAISKSPEQEEKESLVSAMAKDIKSEKERGIEQSLPLKEP